MRDDLTLQKVQGRRDRRTPTDTSNSQSKASLEEID